MRKIFLKIDFGPKYCTKSLKLDSINLYGVKTDESTER